MSRRKVNVVMVGDSGCGKTSLFYRACSGQFKDMGDVQSPMETESLNVSVEKQKVSLMVCDTGGSGLFDSLRQLSYEDADIIIVCYSVSDRKSFEHVSEKWKPELNENTSSERPVLLVATKTDVRKHTDGKDGEIVTTFEGRELENKILATDFMECSAKAGHNVSLVFEKAAEIGLEFDKKKSRKSCQQS